MDNQRIEKALAHAKTVTESVMKFHGKTGHNPSLWLKQKGITDAVIILEHKEHYSELDITAAIDKILSVVPEVPVIKNPPIPTARVFNAENKRREDKAEKERREQEEANEKLEKEKAAENRAKNESKPVATKQAEKPAEKTDVKSS